MDSTSVVSGPWKPRLEQGTVPYNRPTIEKKMYTCYWRCNSVTNINIQRNTKSYNVDLKLDALERKHNLPVFIYPGKTPNRSYNKYSLYYSLMTIYLIIVLLAHMRWKLKKWAFLIVRCPSSVCPAVCL
jgi:hypothetical protein